ncbi:hypothetical protein UlMin_041769 [Ulmus minor]
MARGGSSNNNNNGGNQTNTNRFANLNRFTSDDSNFSQPLISNNYNSWSRAMTMALIAKNKLCFVDGNLFGPSLDDVCYNSWCRCNSKVMSWILHAISREIADSVMYIDNAKDMWNDLYDQFHQSNGPRVFQIKQLLNVLNQGSDEVSSYFTKLKTL